MKSTATITAALSALLALEACAAREPSRFDEQVICVSDGAKVGAFVRETSVHPEYAPRYLVTRIDGKSRHCRDPRLPIAARGVLDDAGAPHRTSIKEGQP